MAMLFAFGLGVAAPNHLNKKGPGASPPLLRALETIERERISFREHQHALLVADVSFYVPVVDEVCQDALHLGKRNE